MWNRYGALRMRAGEAHPELRRQYTGIVLDRDERLSRRLQSLLVESCHFQRIVDATLVDLREWTRTYTTSQLPLS